MCWFCRSWDKVFCVLDGKRLAMYKDQKHAKTVSCHLESGALEICSSRIIIFFCGENFNIRTKFSCFKCVLCGGFQAPNQYFKMEQPLDLNGATCAAATDYKRPHAFRLKLASGGEWLFTGRDDVSFPSFNWQVLSVPPPQDKMGEEPQRILFQVY